MNESMRSVADIPGDDVEDDLSGISPELVLIDPELARLVRERQIDEASLTARTVDASARRRRIRRAADRPGGPSKPSAAPPQPAAPPEPAPSAETVTSMPAPVIEPPREEIAPLAFSASTPVVEEPVVDALPVRLRSPGRLHAA